MVPSSSRGPVVIVNPKSSGGRTARAFEHMRASVERAASGGQIVFTERPGHGREIARDAALEGASAVIVVGGDGSINEVVSGLMQAREEGANETTLGVIGHGTGGDLRRSLGFHNHIEQYCAAIAAGKSRRIDVGSISYETHDTETRRGYFVNVLSVGMGGLVDQLVAERSRGSGRMAYFVASLRALIKSEIGVLDCTLHRGSEVHEEEISTRNLAICNGAFFGSGMKIAPMAELDDGLFEVVDLGSAPKLRFLVVSAPRIYSGTLIEHPDVRHFRCDRIELTLRNDAVADRFLLDVDGEPLGRLPLTVELVPRALPVFVP